MNLVGLALRNLRRRPVRTSLSILGIGLAVGSALALIALSRSIKDSTQEGMDEMGDDLVVMQKGASDIFGGFIPEQMVERIAAIRGVVRASGELFMFAPSAGGNSVLTLGWPDTSYLWKKVPLREGRAPGPGERHLAVLGEAAAASLGKKLGDRLELLGESFRVIGIANYTTIVNLGLVLDRGARQRDRVDRERRAQQRPELCHPKGCVAGGIDHRGGDRGAERAHGPRHGDAGAHPRDRHLRGHRLEQDENHHIDRERGCRDVRARLHPR
jgi:hypothetical protein